MLAYNGIYAVANLRYGIVYTHKGTIRVSCKAAQLLDYVLPSHVSCFHSHSGEDSAGDRCCFTCHCLLACQSISLVPALLPVAEEDSM